MIRCLMLAMVMVSAFADQGSSMTESKKARITCQFSEKEAKSNDAPESIVIHANLATKSAQTRILWTGLGEIGRSGFSILTHSRASNDQNRETLTSFKAFENPGHYVAPSTLVLAANNGDDTDRTIVVQYRSNAESASDLKENRKDGDPDFIDVNLVYISSMDGGMWMSKAAKCSMTMHPK